MWRGVRAYGPPRVLAAYGVFKGEYVPIETALASCSASRYACELTLPFANEPPVEEAAVMSPLETDQMGSGNMPA